MSDIEKTTKDAYKAGQKVDPTKSAGARMAEGAAAGLKVWAKTAGKGLLRALMQALFRVR